METVKTYLVEVVLKKMASVGVQNAISALVVFMVAHQNYLESLGITTYTWGHWPNQVQPSGMCTLIEWDTLTTGGGAVLFGLVVMAFAWIQHHAVATIQGTPQSGDLRQGPDLPVIGGSRKSDLK